LVQEPPEKLIHSTTKEKSSEHHETHTMSAFKQVDLFGGAITADFPAAFGDVR
jgi:predicted DNA repair protein MutK